MSMLKPNKTKHIMKRYNGAFNAIKSADSIKGIILNYGVNNRRIRRHLPRGLRPFV